MFNANAKKTKTYEQRAAIFSVLMCATIARHIRSFAFGYILSKTLIGSFLCNPNYAAGAYVCVCVCPIESVHKDEKHTCASVVTPPELQLISTAMQ